MFMGIFFVVNSEVREMVIKSKEFFQPKLHQNYYVQSNIADLLEYQVFAMTSYVCANDYEDFGKMTSEQ